MRRFICLYLCLLVGVFASAEAEPAPPGTIVIFGASGDLTSRKLVPALYRLTQEGHLSDRTAVVGFARAANSDEGFREQMHDAVNRYIGPVDDALWRSFEQKLFYQRADFDDDNAFAALADLLQKLDETRGTGGNHVFYLATQPSYFATIIRKLSEHGLIGSDRSTKVVVEKPFGYDLESAIALQRHIDEYLLPEQVYRMDHYLGKTVVQFLMRSRVEQLLDYAWNSEYIDHVQITIAEELGIGTRASLWENTGLLRDIVQNHLLQMLAVVTMEPPVDHSPAAIHAEKIKVLNAIRPLDVDNDVVRGQYTAGTVKGAAVPGYTQERGVAEDSQVETYVAARLWIDNPRWQGVPFFIRSGKRLAKQMAEISLTLKNPLAGSKATVLTFRVQPDAAAYLRLVFEEAGIDDVIFDIEPQFSQGQEAYDKLLYDIMSGDSSLFVEGEEQLAAWRLLTPVLQRWQSEQAVPVQTYEAGSRGPAAADMLLEGTGHRWHSSTTD